MNDDEILKEFAVELGIISPDQNFSVNKQLLAERINELLISDFQKLISILYRVDINEQRLKTLLKENPGTDAGLIIADLMIERQIQKIKSRQQYQRDENISDDEKW